MLIKQSFCFSQHHFAFSCSTRLNLTLACLNKILKKCLFVIEMFCIHKQLVLKVDMASTVRNGVTSTVEFHTGVTG